jgi:hypothetical protein
MLSAIVDLDALWKIVVVVMLAGVGITALFGEGLSSLQRREAARRDGRTGAVVLNTLTVVLTAMVFAVALVAGFAAMTHK